MKKQTLRVGIASIVAATLIGAGLTGTAPTADAASNVKMFSNVKAYTVNENTLKDLLGNIDLGSINFNNIAFKLPNCFTPPTGVTPAPSTKPETTPKPTTPVQPTPTTPVKPTPTPPAPTTPVKPAPTTPAPTPTPAPTTEAGLSDFQQQVINLVNRERANAGLSSLTSDSLLTKVSVEKARDMDVNNYFSHTSPTYGSPFDMMRSFGVTYSYAGENIASGQKSPQEVMNAWMNSAGHRANILNGNFSKIGVGYVNGEWVQMFIG